MATKKETNNPIPYNARIKIIRERLARAYRTKPFAGIPKPAKVKAAEKVVAEWDERNKSAREAHYAKHQAKVREIEDALILGDGDKVVKLLAAIGA